MHVTTKKRAPKTVWSERLRRQIPARYELGQDTVAEIAEALRVTESTVVDILKIPVRDRRRRDVLILYKRELGPVKIGRTLNLGTDAVNRYLRELRNQGEIESTACPHCGR